MSSDQLFYQKLRPFTDFSKLVDHTNFARAPDSWHVVLTDVRGSTKAIQSGRYKEVNLIGAASVCCVLNTLGTYDLPFVFGGDGATLLVPEESLRAIQNELLGLQALSKSEFGLELRVGIVPVSTLSKFGAEIWVSKYELSPGNYTAQMKGGGLTLAEEMIKRGQPEGAQIFNAGDAGSPPHLEGLSCRLSPLKSNKGKILAVLIKPTENLNSDATLGLVLAELKAILNGNFLSARPVSAAQLKWKWSPSSIGAEVRLQKGSSTAAFQWLITLLRTFASKVLLTFNVPMGDFKPKTYKSEILTNSDFQKFDDTLRMVIDCTSQQEAAIEELLNKMASEGQVHFGIHRSEEALMTCLVKSASNNKHIHFIDGADGGYALAAAQMKDQIKTAKRGPEGSSGI
ncbi:MAG: DUF3095 domain-containing protein [Oligoflexales bacterium]